VAEEAAARAWRAWAGQTVAVLASGPSMTPADADAVRGLRAIAVNTTFRLAPWADICYSNDEDWIERHIGELRDYFRGQIWCGHPTWRSIWVHPIPFNRDAPGLLAAPGCIAWGMNSGAAAINLAVHHGAARVLLLGFDQAWAGARPRWHGRHPAGLQNQRPGFHRWRAWFQQAAADAPRLGVEIINCSRRTTLECFPRLSLEEALAAQAQPA
jgi:hypothetical protein